MRQDSFLQRASISVDLQKFSTDKLLSNSRQINPDILKSDFYSFVVDRISCSVSTWVLTSDR